MTKEYEARLIEIVRTIRKEHKELLVPVELNEVHKTVHFLNDLNLLFGYILALDPLPVDNEKHEESKM